MARLARLKRVRGVSRGGGGSTPPFNPLSLSPVLWLKADTGLYQDAAGTTPASADGDPVGLWQDQSGNNYHMSQSTAGARPLLKLTTNGINGRAALSFDGANHFLERTVDNWLSTHSAGTLVAVHRLSDPVKTASDNVLFSSSSVAGTAMYLAFNVCQTSNPYPNRIEQRYNDTADVVSNGIGGVPLRRYMGVYRSSGTAYTMRINGADQSLSVVSGANTGDWLSDTSNRNNVLVGAKKISSGLNSFFSGCISEILLFGSSLTGTDLSNLENYLDLRYDIVHTAKTMSFLGDSIAAQIDFGYPLRLSYTYQNGAITRINHAVGGHSIITNMDAQTAAAASDNADIIIIELGTNDNDGGDMAALQAKVESNLAALKASNTHATIYYLNVLPRWTAVDGLTPVAKGNIRTAVAAACAAQSVTCWDTFTTPWITAADTSDGTHPTAAGHNKITNQILARLP